VLQVKKHTPIPSSSIIFTFGLTFESFKEFGVHQEVETQVRKLIFGVMPP
jgi:hypothetical protein